MSKAKLNDSSGLDQMVGNGKDEHTRNRYRTENKINMLNVPQTRPHMFVQNGAQTQHKSFETICPGCHLRAQLCKAVRETRQAVFRHGLSMNHKLLRDLPSIATKRQDSTERPRASASPCSRIEGLPLFGPEPQHSHWRLCLGIF